MLQLDGWWLEKPWCFWYSLDSLQSLFVPVGGHDLQKWEWPQTEHLTAYWLILLG